MDEPRYKVPRTLTPKVWSDKPMEGWKEKGAEEVPPWAAESLRLGIERLREKGFFDNPNVTER